MDRLKALFTTENGLAKPIDAHTHGIIDYCHATFSLPSPSSAAGTTRKLQSPRLTPEP